MSSSVCKKLLDSDYVHVLPDFLDFITDIEARIKQEEFTRTEGALYGGRTMTVLPEHDLRIKQKINSILGVEGLTGHGRIRVTSPQDNGSDQTFIHLDHDCIVLVVFLTDAKDETCFYYHNSVQRKKMAPKESVKDYLIDDVIMTHHARKYDEWKKWLSIQSKRNTALLFDGHLFHSGPLRYTSTEGRITLDYFFNREQLRQLR